MKMTKKAILEDNVVVIILLFLIVLISVAAYVQIAEWIGMVIRWIT